MNLFEQQSAEFQGRHIGPDALDTKLMLETIGAASLEELISKNDNRLPSASKRN